MARGTVTEFREENGFGKMRLDTGEVINFDVVVCNTMEIEVGDEAEVVVKELAGRVVARQVMFDKA